MPFAVLPLVLALQAALGGDEDPLVQTSGLLNGSSNTKVYTWAAGSTVAPTIGHTIMVTTIGWGGGGGPAVNSVSDDAGNVYDKVSDSVQSATRQTIWVARVAAVPTTTTVVWASSADFSIAMTEFEGVSIASFDKQATAGAQAPSSPFTVGPTATLAQSKELLISHIGGNAGSSAGILVPAGFTPIAYAQANDYINMGLGYKVVNSTAAVSAVWTFSNGWGGECTAAIATFKMD